MIKKNLSYPIPLLHHHCHYIYMRSCENYQDGPTLTLLCVGCAYCANCAQPEQGAGPNAERDNSNTKIAEIGDPVFLIQIVFGSFIAFVFSCVLRD